MDLAALALTFGAIFVVELPDKTFLATLVLATKYRPILVWIGVGAAFAVQTTVAVLLGHAASFLPEDVVHVVALVMFLAGAVILVREGRSHQQASGEEFAEAAKDVHRLPGGARLVPGAVRRRVGRPVPAAHDLAGGAVRGARSASSSAPSARCCWSADWPCSPAGRCCGSCRSTCCTTSAPASASCWPR